MPGPTKTQIEGDQIVAGSIADLEISATAAIQISKISINGDMLPDTNNTRALGSAADTFSNLYLKTGLILMQTGAGTNGITIKSPASVTSYNLILPAAQGAASTFLQNDGSGNLSWVAGGSGANVSLSNLSSVAINTALLPGVDNTIALGNSTHNFSSLFLKTSLIMQQTGLGTNAISIQPPSSMASSYSLVLPNAQGGVSTFLQNDGSGNLSWSAGGGVGYREDYIVGTALNNYTGSTTVFNLVNAYNVGGHTLIVTEDGDIQTLGASADYLETNSTTVTFNYALVVGQRVSFIFSQPPTSPSGIVNSGTIGNLAVYSGSTTISSITGSVSANSQKITSLANGTAAQDAVTFAQVSGQRILQIVPITTTTQTVTTSATFGNTALVGNITCASTASKVLIIATGLLASSGGFWVYATLARGGTNLGAAQGFQAQYGQAIDYIPSTMVYLDSPASTASLAYSVQIAVNTPGNNGIWGAGSGTVTTQTMYLVEIG